MVFREVVKRLVRELLKRFHGIPQEQVERLPGFLVELYSLSGHMELLLFSPRFRERSICGHELSKHRRDELCRLNILGSFSAEHFSIGDRSRWTCAGNSSVTLTGL